MCEIFAANLHKEQQINEYLKVFFSHSPNHPHGWGLAIADGNNVSVEKEPVQASKSLYLKNRLSHQIIVKTAMAHIRYATIGNVEYRNCHPYSKFDNRSRRWTMIHNGTIFEYSPLDKFFKKQKGDTDSERILLYIIEQINTQQKAIGRPLDPEERFDLLDSIVCDMAKGNKLNLLIFDGEYMYAHSNYFGSLHYLETDGGMLFSTLPLNDEGWRKLPLTTLHAFKNGKLAFKGTNHRNEFFDNEESLKYLYQIFADL
ncbi:MAG: class II glutamine amidotransferase [Ruminococcus sp.]|nr:class II glutamine amidotransferase [Ruminococcus sp.]